MSREKYNRVLEALDQVILSNTDSSATLIFLAEEVEKLYRELGEHVKNTDYMQGKIISLQRELRRLATVEEAARQVVSASSPPQLKSYLAQLRTELFMASVPGGTSHGTTLLPFQRSRVTAPLGVELPPLCEEETPEDN